MHSSFLFFFFFKQKTAYEIGLGIPAEPLFRNMIKLLSRKPTALRLVNPSAAKIKIFTARSEERFSRNAETDLVCRLLLEKKKMTANELMFSASLSSMSSTRNCRMKEVTCDRS